MGPSQKQNLQFKTVAQKPVGEKTGPSAKDVKTVYPLNAAFIRPQ